MSERTYDEALYLIKETFEDPCVYPSSALGTSLYIDDLRVLANRCLQEEVLRVLPVNDENLTKFGLVKDDDKIQQGMSGWYLRGKLLHPQPTNMLELMRATGDAEVFVRTDYNPPPINLPPINWKR